MIPAGILLKVLIQSNKRVLDVGADAQFTVKFYRGSSLGQQCL